MQLGTRWTSGDEPPAAVPAALRASIADVDDAVRPDLGRRSAPPLDAHLARGAPRRRARQRHHRAADGGRRGGRRARPRHGVRRALTGRACRQSSSGPVKVDARRIETERDGGGGEGHARRDQVRKPQVVAGDVSAEQRGEREQAPREGADDAQHASEDLIRHDGLAQRAPRHVPGRDRERHAGVGDARAVITSGASPTPTRHTPAPMFAPTITAPAAESLHEQGCHERPGEGAETDAGRDEPDRDRLHAHLVEEVEDRRRLREREGAADDRGEEHHGPQVVVTPQVRGRLLRGDAGHGSWPTRADRRGGRARRCGIRRPAVDDDARPAERPRGRERQEEGQHDRDDVARGADPQRQRQRDGEQDSARSAWR